jgi:hypothetical protein
VQYCGRQFGTASLSIHQKQCAEKFKIQHDLLPKNIKKRVKISCHSINKNLKPSEIYDSFDSIPIKGKKGFKLEETPTKILSLIECKYCGRNFAMDRIEKHEKVFDYRINLTS